MRHRATGLCFASMKPWVQIPVQLKKKKKETRV
jgi:hypothetical protein